MKSRKEIKKKYQEGSMRKEHPRGQWRAGCGPGCPGCMRTHEWQYEDTYIVVQQYEDTYTAVCGDTYTAVCGDPYLAVCGPGCPGSIMTQTPV